MKKKMKKKMKSNSCYFSAEMPGVGVGTVITSAQKAPASHLQPIRILLNKADHSADIIRHSGAMRQNWNNVQFCPG